MEDEEPFVTPVSYGRLPECSEFYYGVTGEKLKFTDWNPYDVRVVCDEDGNLHGMITYDNTGLLNHLVVDVAHRDDGIGAYLIYMAAASAETRYPGCTVRYAAKDLERAKEQLGAPRQPGLPNLYERYAELLFKKSTSA
jgi:GNAT superfamily N-acetyltransferase